LVTEDQNDGYYWEPEPVSPLRQGDLLLNVPSTLLPNEPEFLIRHPDGKTGSIQSYTRFPDNTPGEDLVVTARWGSLCMVMTPTCHVSDHEKNGEIVAVVPVDPALAHVTEKDVETLRKGKGGLNLFLLPRTELGDGVMPFDCVALLDRPTSLYKHDLRHYRKLGLYVDQRFALRKKMAYFWARASASHDLDKMLEGVKRGDRPLHEIE
jgi:hypothetical protein